MSYKTVVTKANLQYYHGKLQRLLDKLGTVKTLSVGSETSTVIIDPSNITENVKVANVGYETFQAHASANSKGGADVNYENFDNAIATTIYGQPDDGTVRFATYYSSAANNKDATVYDKDAVDAKFDAINGMSFQLVDTTMFPTLNSFLTGTFTDSSGTEPQVEPWFWYNKIALYPSDGEYLEYVLIVEGTPEYGAEGWMPHEWEANSHWEFVGSTKQDLTGYLKDEDIEATDNDYIDAVFVMDWAPGLYDSSGNMVKTWDEMIAEVDTGKYYLTSTTDSYGRLTITGRSYPWPANGTILVLPDNIYSISNLRYSGENGEANKTIPLEGMFIPKKPDGWTDFYCGMDTMTFYEDMDDNPYTRVPNLRWIAGEVKDVSYQIPNPNGTTPMYIDGCKFFQMF